MSAEFTRDHVKLSVAKILQTLGWHSINVTPLEVMTDILDQYITQLSKITNDYASEFGQTEPNLDHLGLALRDMGVNLPELEEYVTYVNFGPPPASVPKYPIPKENNLSFLKPGSKEVVTRPVHIHEHLPPMYPLLEESGNEGDVPVIKKEESEEPASENGQLFKKPSDVPSEFKRSRKDDESSRPTREISSVMMTTSGFLSPAREGKLPEAKSPAPTIIDPVAPIPPPTVTAPPNVEPLDLIKRTPKIITKKIEKKKIGKELFKALPMPEKMQPRILKTEGPKVKHPKMNPLLNMFPKGDLKVQMSPGNRNVNSAKINKTLADARLKTEKFNTTITPIPTRPDVPPPTHPTVVMQPTAIGESVDKLFTEPDKKKMNIFKKISNVKNDIKAIKKDELKPFMPMQNLIVDEPEELTKVPIFNDVTIERVSSPTMVHKSPAPDKNDGSYYDDGSPPGTPSTPKTPEIYSPPISKAKRKRKDSRKVRKITKDQSPLSSEIIDLEMERPKTPEASMLSKQDLAGHLPMMNPHMQHPQMPFPFLPNLGGPGLIPNLNNPLFPGLPSMAFGKNPYPIPTPNLPHLNHFVPPLLFQNYLPPHANKQVEEPLPKPKPQIPSPVPAVLAPVPVEQPPPAPVPPMAEVAKPIKKIKEHKKDKKDKIKKKSKKDKIKNKSEKRKIKEEKKEKIKKEKKDKKKDKEVGEGKSPVPKIFLKIASPSPRPETPESTRKLNIKPIVKRDEEVVNITVNTEERKREPSPGLAKISALVTGPPKQKTAVAPPPVIPPVVEEPVHIEPPPVIPLPKPSPGPGRPRIHPIKQPKQSPPKPKKPRKAPVKKDKDGNEVWICPACGQQDDGSPMIGCDDCDAWYHWVCVGIQVPPDENENWYCRVCLLKKNEDLLSDKKKKRKKRDKKEL